MHRCVENLQLVDDDTSVSKQGHAGGWRRADRRRSSSRGSTRRRVRRILMLAIKFAPDATFITLSVVGAQQHIMFSLCTPRNNKHCSRGDGGSGWKKYNFRLRRMMEYCTRVINQISKRNMLCYCVCTREYNLCCR